MDKKTITENIERIENISEPGDNEAAELRFKKLADVFKYLQSQGARISRATLYRHAAEGKLLPEKGGIYKKRNIERYAKTFLKLTIDSKLLSAKSKINLEDLSSLQAKRLILENNLLEYKAAREKMKKEREEGELINAQAALDATFTVFRETRDAMLSIPDRITEIVAAETDPDRVRQILKDEIRHALINLCESKVVNSGKSDVASDEWET